MPQHLMLDAVLNWARREDAIRAVVITGSLARADGSADDYSDLDAQIITTDIRRFTSDDSWLDALGEVWIRFPLGEPAPFRLVWFAGGVKVDFQFIHVDRIRRLAQSDELATEYQRGYSVALDKDGLYQDLPPSTRVFPQPALPSADELLATINEFWFEAIHVAQFIRRREFWVVKFRDWTMKENLLRLLEWHTRATSGANVNTWLLGKRILHWTDGETAEAIQQIWSRWDAEELWSGLLIQLELFLRLSVNLCRVMELEYDDRTHRAIEHYIRGLRREDREP